HRIRRMAGDVGQCLKTVGGLERLIALGPQEQHEIPADRPVIVSNQDSDGFIHVCQAPKLSFVATGRIRVKTAPVPAVRLAACRAPRWAGAISLAMASPSPVPSALVV